MEKSIGDFVNDIKSVFVFSSDYIMKESTDIRKKIEENLPEVNCKRIVAMMPVFFILCIFYMADVLVFRHRETMQLSLSICLILIVLGIIYSILLIRCLYVRELRHRDRSRKCTLLYRSFWWIWLVGMLALCALHFVAGMSGALYIFVCIVICLVPLYPKRDFVFILLTLIATLVLAAFAAQKNVQFAVYNYVVMLVIGFIAQQFQIGIWTMREYIYMTAFLDPLTGLLNRRGGNALLAENMEAAREETSIGVVMLDIDFFKKYNDSLGHDAGDECLKTVGHCIKDAVGEKTRLLIRHGGEEFVVLFIDTTEQELKGWAEKIRKNVFERGIEAPFKEVADVVTVSVGASISTEKPGETYESLLEQADAALYTAKESGRNRVVFR